jgi:hypothetical protein
VNILLWHVHGSWTTSFVAGDHHYLLPVLPDRGPDGRGRATSWNWPESAVELTAGELAEAEIDVVVLQRPHEAALAHQLTGRRPGRDVPALYLEHNAPTEHAVSSTHPVVARADLAGIPVVHVTKFNAMAWDCGRADTAVVEHGIHDPGPLYTGADPSLAVVVNEPVRRWRVAGTDLLLDLATHVPLHVYGMGSELLADAAREWAEGEDLDAGQKQSVAGLAGRLHDLPQEDLHRALAHHRGYFHPYRWTSLGLSLLEAMTIGMPVLGLSTTEAPYAVPAGAGLLSNDLDELRDLARRWLRSPELAREQGQVARSHALAHYGLDRFLTDWDQILKEVAR